MLPSHAQLHPIGPTHGPGIENSRDGSLRVSRDEATFHQSLLLWGRLCPVAPTAVDRSWQRRLRAVRADTGGLRLGLLGDVRDGPVLDRAVLLRRRAN